MSPEHPTTLPPMPHNGEVPLHAARREFLTSYGKNKAIRKDLRSKEEDTEVDLPAAIDGLFAETGYHDESDVPKKTSVEKTVTSMFHEQLDDTDTPILTYSQTHVGPIKKEVQKDEPGKFRRAFRYAKAIGKSLLAHDTDITAPPATDNIARDKSAEKSATKRTLALAALGLLAAGGGLFMNSSRSTEGVESSAAARPPAATAATLPETTIGTSTTVTTRVLAAEIAAPKDVTSSATEAQDEISEAIDTPKIIIITEENNSLWKALKSQDSTATDTEIQNTINDIASRYNLDNVNIVHSGNQFTLSS